MVLCPPLPYPQDALEPVLSRSTVKYHRAKQERYARRTTELVQGTSLAELSLGDVVDEASRLYLTQSVIGTPSVGVTTLYEQANQAWNHALMWRSMAPTRVAHVRPWWINELREDWRAAAAQIFASGWVWLVLTPTGRVVVESTTDAQRPTRGLPIAVMDVWEHAYYLDFPDAKTAYVDAWWDRLADWQVAADAVESDGRIYPKELR